LSIFQRYTLHTRVVGWNEKWIYIEQRFISNDQLIAQGRIKGLLRGRSGNINSNTVMKKLGIDHPSPSLPRDFVLWQQLQKSELENNLKKD